MKPPRVVLDTNVVLSVLVFGGDLARIRTAWETQQFVPPGSTATVNELLRALTYPKFGLTLAEQEELLAAYVPYVEAVRIPEPPPTSPACHDPNDLPFLHLAIAGGAMAIVSSDRDLLALDGTRGLCSVLTAEAFAERFGNGSPLSRTALRND